jgi:hypothetical protein
MLHKVMNTLLVHLKPWHRAGDQIWVCCFQRKLLIVFEISKLVHSFSFLSYLGHTWYYIMLILFCAIQKQHFQSKKCQCLSTLQHPLYTLESLQEKKQEIKWFLGVFPTICQSRSDYHYAVSPVKKIEDHMRYLHQQLV